MCDVFIHVVGSQEIISLAENFVAHGCMITSSHLLRQGYFELTQGDLSCRGMIDRLGSAREFDLLAISQIVGGLVFKEGSERDWFKWRFSMFQDILRFYLQLRDR